MSSAPRLDVIYEDNHLLVVNKPAGLVTIGVGEDEQSLAKLAKAYIKRRYHKPGNVYLGVMSRLDSVVSGVVVLARTSKAAARCTEQFRNRSVQKLYWAIVAGPVKSAREACVDWIAKDEARGRMAIVPYGSPSGQEARLNYRLLQSLAQGSLLEIELLTGRKHQIRVQLAFRGLEILGDKKYGSHESFASGIALHARQTTLHHPTRDEMLTFVAPLPDSWERRGVRG